MSTRDLLKRQDRVFTKKKRDFGLPSVLISVVSVVVLLPVYASYVGAVLRVSWAMVLAGVLLAVAVPWFLARRMRSRGPRLFALINVLFAVFLFTVLGKSTDGVLADHGQRPFDSLASLMGAEDSESHSVSGIGRGFIGLLRSITMTGSPEAEDASEEAPSDGPPAADDEPRARMIPPSEAAEIRDVVEPSADAGSGDPPEGRGIQAHVVSAADATASESGAFRPEPVSGSSAGWGTYNVFSQRRSTVEVPIQRDGRTFTVGVLIDGRVPADFVFDTGADFTAITPALARRLGLDPEKLEDILPFHTAGGIVHDPVVRIGSLSIDHAEVRDVEVVVCRLCSQNLLGRNFHGLFRVEIDSGLGMLRLHSR